MADTKITGVEGTFLCHEQKLYGELTNKLFGYSGSQDMIKLLRMCVVGEAVMLRDSKDKYLDSNILEKISGLMNFFTQIRSGQFFQLTIMIAMYIGKPSRPELHVIDSKGRIESKFTLPYKTIGSGADKADSILTGEWKDNMSMTEFARLGYCIIKFMEDIDPKGSVGGDPHIRYLPYGSANDIEPKVQEWIDFKESLPKCLADFRSSYPIII